MRASYADLIRQASLRIDRLDAELLLAYVTQRSREFFVTHGTDTASWYETLRYGHIVRARERGTPLAYLTGRKQFYGLDFRVNKHTLIPRPDTEILVESVITSVRQSATSNQQIILVDTGTGSGCIPIAITKAIKHESMKTVATDISRSALRVAKQNAKIHQVPIAFFHGNLLSPITRLVTRTYNLVTSIVITANLPYLTQAQFESEPSIQHEPRAALVANNEGLALYEQLLEQIQLLRISNQQAAIHCFFEIDPSQTARITAAIHRHFPAAEIDIKKDLAMRDRVVVFSI